MRILNITGLVARGVLATLLVFPTLSVAQPKQGSETQEAMQGIFVTLVSVYKYSLDPEAFQDPVNRQRILTGLNALAHNAAQLEQHMELLDPSFDFLRRSLARDARDLAQRFKDHQYVGARFVLGKITENCITCHSKLPAERQFDVGDRFLQDTAIQELHPLVRVDLELATRQFDSALGTYEQLFVSPDVSAESLALVGAFERYLRVCIGVRGDIDRATGTLEKLSAREDVPLSMKATIGAWLESLRSIDLSVPTGDELRAARTIIDRAEASRSHPSDRSQLVELVAASALLHRYLQREDLEEVSMAEALYELGVAESYMTRSYWISETDFLLETAIRTAPKSEVARRAYGFLEEYTLSGHALTARTVPEDLKKRLESLRELMEGE